MLPIIAEFLFLSTASLLEFSLNSSSVLCLCSINSLKSSLSVICFPHADTMDLLYPGSLSPGCLGVAPGAEAPGAQVQLTEPVRFSRKSAQLLSATH